MLEAKAFSQLSGLKYHQSPSLKGSAEEERSIGWPHQQKYSKISALVMQWVVCFAKIEENQKVDVVG